MKIIWTPLSVFVLLLLTACDKGAQGTKDALPVEVPDQVISVHVAQVQSGPLQAWIYGQGTLRSRHREFLTFTQPGMVTMVDPGLRVGSRVRAGQVIAQQNPERVNADLQAARAALAQTQANLSFAQVTQQRYETLIAQSSAAQQELDQARVQVQQAIAARDSAQARLAQAQISVNESRLVSPINGVISRLNTEKGRYFMPASVQTGTESHALRTVPAVIIDPDRFEVRVDLPSFHFRQIALGAQVVIGADPPGEDQAQNPTASRDPAIRGTVFAVRPSLDPESRMFEVTIHADAKGMALQDGEFVAVWIQEPARKLMPSVPQEALRFRNGHEFVFVYHEVGSRVEERAVELGVTAGQLRAVQNGLTAGEWVVTEGRAALHDGQRVKLLGEPGVAR